MVRQRGVIIQESLHYNGRVRVTFSEAQHRYYMYVDGGKNTFPSGVTGILSTLYDQRALLDWYSSTSSAAIIKELGGTVNHERLDKAFLSLYKGEDVSPIEGKYWQQHDHVIDLIELYKLGIAAPHVKSKYGTDVGTQTHDAVDRYHKTGQKYIIESGVPENDKAATKSFNAYVKWYEQSGLEVIASEVVACSIEHNYAGTLDRIYKDKSGGLIMGDFKTSNLSRSYPLGIHAQYWSQLGAYMVGYIEEHGVTFKDAVIVNSPKQDDKGIKIGYASDMGLTPQDCQTIWLDDLRAMNNHKRVEKQLHTLKSRIGEE